MTMTTAENNQSGGRRWRWAACDHCPWLRDGRGQCCLPACMADKTALPKTPAKGAARP